MKLTVPTNWDDGLIEKIKKPGVETVYGKLDRDFIGGGRPSCVLSRISHKKARIHIELLHQQGLKFLYLLNSSCLGNKEWTIAGQKKIGMLLDWLSGMKIYGVVVATPYIFQLVRKRYPNFKISVSSFANVNSVERAKFWQDLGASVITLPQIELNRDFQLLEKIRKNLQCEVQLLVNDNCLQNCPLFYYHNNIVSHASEISAKLGSYIFDYCRLMCRYSMLIDPSNFIKAAWIRPEDLKVYETIGIDNFKLVDRTMDTISLGNIVEAYSTRTYKGNLYDLFTNPSKSQWIKKTGLFHKLKYFFHPFSVNILKLAKKRNLVTDIKVNIDNTKLEGFINHFLNHNCRSTSCNDCGYCTRIAMEVITFSPEYNKKLASEYEQLLRDIISGEMFKY